MKTRKQLGFIKLAAVILILLLLNQSTISSQTTFEKVYYMGLQNIGHHIIETSDNNFLFVSGGYTGPDHSYFLKIDPTGNIIWKKDFSVSGLASGSWVIETKDNKYGLLSEEQFWDPIAIVLRKSTPSGSLNWTSKYPAPHSGPYAMYRSNSMEEGLDSSFVSIGCTQTGTNKCYASSFSKSGSFNWYKEILDSIDLVGLRIKATYDSCYIALANYTNEGNSQLIKLSKIGDVIWNKKLYNFIGNTLIVDSNNDFLIGGSALTLTNKATPVLSKYSFIGDSIWRADYSNITSKNIISNSMIMLNSNSFMIVVQSEKMTSNKYYGVVLNTDSLLNTISSDTVNLTKTNDCIYGVSVPNMSISSVSGGGYCLIGTIDSIASYTPRTFVKVSRTFTSISSFEKPDDNVLLMYPNPTTGILQIEYSLVKNEILQFEIYDLKGERLLVNKLKSEQKFATINCSRLSNGIYFYQMIVGNQISKTGKLVIAK